ncbi:MAG: hypothetical protein PWP24_11 [Clostridiales bacterium]|nr:hypothetical protein [Clostridiales bacterium]
MLKKASITVEAAMVLPLFLFFFFGVLQGFSILSLQHQIQMSLTKTANQMSLAGYASQKEKSVAALQLVFMANLESDYFGESCIEGGLVLLTGSSYEGEDLTLVANYRMKLPVPLWNHVSLPVKQQVKTRLFVGRDKTKESDNKEKEEIRYVYITDTGTVYHESETCTHLRLRISTISKEDLVWKRNEGGAKYYPCEHCMKEKEPNEGKEGSLYFITQEGNRFHCRRDCSGLKRTVYKVPFEQVKTWRACKRCGS